MATLGKTRESIKGRAGLEPNRTEPRDDSAEDLQKIRKPYSAVVDRVSTIYDCMRVIRHERTVRLVHGHSASVRLTSSTKACRILTAGFLKTNRCPPFLGSALAFDHRARCAAGIFLRAAGDMVQVFRKCLNAAESPAALTLGLLGHHTAA